MRFFMGLLCSWPVFAGATSATELPQTPAGKLIADWIEVCASPNLDQEHMTAWIQSHLSDLGAKRRPRDTQFTIGSMSKLFTAVAIGQLIDQKKASFSDTVGRFLPNYPNAVVATISSMSQGCATAILIMPPDTTSIW
jgi:CubicO group peptidase (beta-lactamase class C family)